MNGIELPFLIDTDNISLSLIEILVGLKNYRLDIFSHKFLFLTLLFLCFVFTPFGVRIANFLYLFLFLYPI